MGELATNLRHLLTVWRFFGNKGFLGYTGYKPYWLQARIAVRRDIHEHSCILFHRLQQPWPLSSHGPYLGQM
ncbi:hypothetical protein, partial [Thiolapillus sp.]